MTNHEQCLELACLIREGCKKSKKIEYFLFARNKFEYFTCVLGTILDAKGKLDLTSSDTLAYQFLDREFPVLRYSFIGPDTLATLLVRKNDSERKSREEIADWLESLEWPNE